MTQRIDPEVAAEAMRAAGYEPLIPYPGAGEKWECLCLGCGEIREPRYSHLKRGTKCAVCTGNAPYGDARATEIMREHGLFPLTPYPGRANDPWPSLCVAKGHEVSPRLATVSLRGTGCDRCGKESNRLNGDEAAALMRAHGWEPLVPYPGSRRPWQSRCNECKTVRTPLYDQVKGGVACGGCSGTDPLDPDVAVARMVAGGARPLVPYETAATKWECECLVCFEVIYPRLNQVTQGHGVCGYCAGTKRFEDEQAAQMMRTAGYEPLVPYPGSSKPWKARCEGCGAIRRPALNKVRSRGARCGHGVAAGPLTHDAAAEVMLAAGFEPLEPYPGSGTAWSCRCTECLEVVSPAYSAILRGTGGCMSCRMSLSLPGRSAGMYLIVHEGLQAVKFGMGLVRHGLFPRVRAHEQNGWTEVSRWVGFNDVRVVLGVERLVLARWRSEGIAGFVGRSAMPQGGWSETAPLVLVNLDDLVGMVTVAVGEVSDSLPVLVLDEAFDESGE